MTAPIFPLLNASDEVKSYLESGGIYVHLNLVLHQINQSRRTWSGRISLVFRKIIQIAPANIDHVTIQVDIYTTNADDLRNIREAVRRAFELDNSCTVTGLRGNERDPDSKMYRTGFDSNWFVDR